MFSEKKINDMTWKFLEFVEGAGSFPEVEKEVKRKTKVL